MRILVAEDNPVNRELLRQWLTHMGHYVQLAEDGRAAADLACSERFDLVFMDLWMPGLDGVQATEIIRKAEQDTGRHVPIVAVTAHAIKGDSKACFVAGMDAYLSKPIRRQALMEILARYATKPGDGATGVTPEQASVLLGWEGVDRDILPRLAPMMISTTTETMGDLKSALQGRDAVRVERLAHSMKGSFGMFRASKALETTRRLEAEAHEGNWDKVLSEYERLDRHLPTVYQEIRSRASMP